MSMWDAVAERGTEVRFVPGSVLVHRGDRSRHCYAIRSGEVLVTASSQRGANLVLARRGPGTMIGEHGALDGEPRSATVTAVTDVVAIVLSGAEFEQLLRDVPDLALAELRRLSRQLRELTDRFALQAEDLHDRILGVLDTHARETGDLAFRSTREELAAWVGASREAVTRALRVLEAEGAVRLGRGMVERLGPPR